MTYPECETYEHRGLTIKIYQDESPESPRDWDNVGTMLCWHPDYVLGNEQFDRSSGYKSLEHLRRHLGIVKDAVVILPLYLYDHSGITMRVGSSGDYPFDSAGWDTSDVGFIYVTRLKVIEEYGDDSPDSRKRAEDCLRGEVSTYAQFLEGDVYGYVIEDKDGEHLDSCWGFYGFEEVKAEAEGIAEGMDLRQVVKDRRARILAEATKLAARVGATVTPR